LTRRVALVVTGLSDGMATKVGHNPQSDNAYSISLLVINSNDVNTEMLNYIHLKFMHVFSFRLLQVFIFNTAKIHPSEGKQWEY